MTSPVSASADRLLSIENVTSGYGASIVLRGVSLHVAPGETLGLLGRNGMGKTTLLRTIMGLLRPRDGRISFSGRTISGARPSAIARSGLAIVPEGRGIFPNLTVEENLDLAARPDAQGGRAWTRERIFETFPRLAERRRHWGNQLSGGEQQMLAIGRALMTNPKLVMLDEATEGLAPKVRDEIWSTLRKIAGSGISAIVIDKNLGDLFELATRNVILAKGEVVFDGPTAELRNNGELIRRWLGV
ncbi:MAG: ABC transporter ATP-binding protein [Beijerinckiaceae bacterium]